MTRLAGLLLGIALLSCSSGGESPPVDDDAADGVVLPDGRTFTRRALLEDVASCVTTRTAELATTTAALRDATAAAGADPSALEDAREAWRATMAALQQLEPMQVGPAAIKTQLGGRGLRDQMYAWPLVSPCGVSEMLLASGWESPDFDEALINVRGLATAEQLLFAPDAGNGCDADHPMNAEGTWAALGDEEIAARRLAYARAVTEDVDRHAVALRDAWAPSGEDFAGELGRAGDGSRTFSREALALNAISDALFYVEYATKDLKVARPAGLTGCDAASCPELVESPWAGTSVAHLRDDLLGFRAIFDGCTEGALGFDDYLTAAGAPDLAASLHTGIDEAVAAVDAIEEADLAAALAADPASVTTLHAALKRITDLLRTQFLSVLDLEIPRRVEGDND